MFPLRNWVILFLISYCFDALLLVLLEYLWLIDPEIARDKYPESLGICLFLCRMLVYLYEFVFVLLLKDCLGFYFYFL